MCHMSLNLLPPNKQRLVARTQVADIVSDFLLHLFLMVAVIAMVLLTGQLLLQSNLVKVVRDYNLLTINQPPLNREVQTINRFLNQAAQVQNNFWPLLPSLTKLENTLAPDVLLKSVEFTKEKIILDAVAPNREAALTWQTRLQKNTGWKNVFFSLNDLIQAPPLSIKLTLPRL